MQSVHPAGPTENNDQWRSRSLVHRQDIFLQCVYRPVFWLTVMLLLGVVCAKRRCNYSVILSNYRTLTLVELKSLNLTGPFDAPKGMNRCPSKKVPHILRSIYNLTQVFACFSKGQQKDGVTEVVARMGLFIRQNCRKILVTRQKPFCKTGRQKKQRRQRMKMVKMLVYCWQKLQSVHA